MRAARRTGRSNPRHRYADPLPRSFDQAGRRCCRRRSRNRPGSIGPGSPNDESEWRSALTRAAVTAQHTLRADRARRCRRPSPGRGGSPAPRRPEPDRSTAVPRHAGGRPPHGGDPRAPTRTAPRTWPAACLATWSYGSASARPDRQEAGAVAFAVEVSDGGGRRRTRQVRRPADRSAAAEAPASNRRAPPRGVCRRSAPTGSASHRGGGAASTVTSAPEIGRRPVFCAAEPTGHAQRPGVDPMIESASGHSPASPYG